MLRIQIKSTKIDVFVIILFAVGRAPSQDPDPHYAQCTRNVRAIPYTKSADDFRNILPVCFGACGEEGWNMFIINHITIQKYPLWGGGASSEARNINTKEIIEELIRLKAFMAARSIRRSSTIHYFYKLSWPSRCQTYEKIIENELILQASMAVPRLELRKPMKNHYFYIY